MKNKSNQSGRNAGRTGKTRINLPKFVLSDGGRSMSLRPHEKNDCSVRVLALATGTGYDRVYRFLRRNGRQPNEAFYNWVKFMHARKEIFGCVVSRVRLYETTGRRRITVADFLERFPRGIFIVKIKSHVAAIIDGQLFDDSDEHLPAFVYAAHEFTRTKIF